MDMEPFIGQVTIFAGNFAPRGWAFCEGQLLPISSNTALFSILGTTYGGDGRTTFGLPDLRGRFPTQQGTGPGLSHKQLGQAGGLETTTQTENQMPNHGHNPRFFVETVASTTNIPSDGVMLALATTGGTKLFANVDPATEVALANDSIKETRVGGGQAMDTMNPFLALNFIIALQGVFPSRS